MDTFYPLDCERNATQRYKIFSSTAFNPYVLWVSRSQVECVVASCLTQKGQNCSVFSWKNKCGGARGWNWGEKSREKSWAEPWARQDTTLELSALRQNCSLPAALLIPGLSKPVFSGLWFVWLWRSRFSIKSADAHGIPVPAVAGRAS